MADIKRSEADAKLKPNGYAEVLGFHITEKGEVVLHFADNSRNSWRVLLGQINPAKKVTLTSGGKTSVCFLLDA